MSALQRTAAETLRLTYLYVVAMPERQGRMGAEDKHRPGQEAPGEVGDSDLLAGADGAATPPIRMTITVWFDRDPELDTNGLADYIAYAALYECIQPLETELLSRHLVGEDEEGEED